MDALSWRHKYRDRSSTPSVIYKRALSYAWNLLNVFAKTCDVCSTSRSFILLIWNKHLEAAKNCYSEEGFVSKKSNNLYSAKTNQFPVIYWKLEEYLTSKIHLNEYFLSIQISLDWQARVLLHWITIVIEWMVTPAHCKQKASKEATMRALIKGLCKISENLFMLKLSHVDFNLLDRKEKNIPSKGNDRNICELWKRKSNCQTEQQLLKKLKYKKNMKY